MKPRAPGVPGGAATTAERSAPQELSQHGPSVPINQPRRDPRRGQIRWIRIWLRDHSAVTARLSLAAHGAYVRLVHVMVERQAPVPDDARIPRLIGCTRAEWRRVREELLDMGDLCLDADGWHSAAADESIAYFRERAATNRTNRARRFSVIGGVKS